MPTIKRADTRRVAESIKSAIEVHYGCDRAPECSTPAIYTGDHEEVDTDWVLSWEEGPYEWVYDETMTEIIEEVCKTAGEFYGARFRTETVRGWGVIALFVD